MRYYADEVLAEGISLALEIADAINQDILANHVRGQIKVTRVRDLTIDESEYLIEHKILEALGNPDSRLELSEEFKQELKG